MPRTRPIADRFWSKVSGGDVAQCWIWTASLDRHGYGSFGVSKYVRVGAHRWSYTHLIGDIPSGLSLDHLCRNKTCVNPWHLEPVTWRVNNSRGSSPSAANARKTKCKRGHPLEGPNLMVRSSGSRNCRACEDERNRSRRVART